MIESSSLTALTWLGILFCISQSAMFSGLNLALFGISRLELEVEASSNNRAALKILQLRKDSNFLLTTILWGNVSINVLLTLLSDSVMAGVSAFVFSTVIITFFGEITPQAYFSRNALRMGSLLAPLLRFYQYLFYPVAKPSAWVLDRWLGKEGVQYFAERDMHAVIKKHIDADESDIDRIEGMGALNFLALDDLLVADEGEPVDPASVIVLPCENGRPVYPAYDADPADPFLLQVNASGKKWVIVTDSENEPHLVLNADDFLRATLWGGKGANPYAFSHRPIVVKDAKILMGKVISRLKVYSHDSGHDVIDEDLVLVWTDQKRVITGADILGRLLRGIAARKPASPALNM